ncbi:MAG: MBL fold metallo-hydrolase [Acidobacteriota bacterium]|nr:MBL fold metallo-hydrolase [Acidobacteriota bacterium]
MAEITATELKDRLEAGEPLTVLDIREEDEFGDWHIRGSRNLPVYNAIGMNLFDGLEQGAEELPKNRPVVTVCRGGVRSQAAAAVLREKGLDAFSLAGGLRAWGGVWTVARIPLESCLDAVFVQIRRNGKGCLSYLLGDDGEAAVVDPSVECRAYMEVAESNALKIARVIETHVHADHLSRARELCRLTGATLVLPPNGRVNFEYAPAEDEAVLAVGGLNIETIATPGHTGESVCYLVNEEILLTGDTLFVDSVGRPDLEKGDAGAEAGARSLYHSLNKRLLSRFDDLGVYPAHHAEPVGFDGVPIGGSLRELRRSVDLLKLAEDDFVTRIVDGLSAKPPNFEAIIAVNEGKSALSGIDPLDLEAGPNRCAAG